MKENNWEQVKDIFQAVIERPATERDRYLNEVCRGDESLSEEVRELLDSFKEEDSFFDGGAIGEVAELLVDSEGQLKSGARLGRYQVKSMLGAGGMGEVFLAEDTELERPVALKILSAAFSDDADRVRRFTREAKSVSALNHPNILTIYEIGRFNDLHFIATEYIKGETLRQRQKRTNFNAREIIDIIVQAATALSAAHEARIVHRDIKPENIMIREDGLVKVLDFGLAKSVEKRRETSEIKAADPTINTTPGLLLGTVAYMSPEQARGNPTDAQTDIWSLGVCLYEMIAGFKPFSGETTSDTLASVLTSEPLPLSDKVPPELNRIIYKCLQKKCENRYQTVNDLLFDLKSLRRGIGDETGRWKFNGKTADGYRLTAVTNEAPAGQWTKVNQPNPAPYINIESKPRFRRSMTAAALGALMLAAIGFASYKAFNLTTSTAAFQKMRFTRLTQTGNVSGDQLAISPDGKYTVYMLREAAGQSLWVNQIATLSNIQIVAPANVEYGGVTFSHDGDYIYYSAIENKNSSVLYRVPVLGGDSQKMIDNVERPVTFSPDGKRMAFVRDEKLLMTADAEGGREEPLATASPGKTWNFAAWSPDGETIAVTTFSAADTHTNLVEIAVKDGTEKPIASPPWLRVSGIAWLPDKSGLIVSGRDYETKLSQIWAVNYPDGTLSKTTNDLSNYLGLSMSGDGKTIAGIQYERVSNVWVTDKTEPRLASQITTDKNRDEGLSGVASTPDGKIIYTAGPAGTQDLWITDQEGVNKRQLTADAKSNFSPEVSPDNRYIAFISTRSGSANLWRMDLDGNNQKLLAGGPNTFSVPMFSPDGKWIVYHMSDAAGVPTVWKISTDGGTPVQMTDVFSGKPVISPDGEFFACNYKAAEDSQIKIAVISLSGKKPIKMFDFPQVVKSPMFRWTPDGRGLLYISSQNNFYNLWSQSLDEAPPKQLTDFKSEEIFRFDLMPDGRSYALARGHESSDVIVINNFR